MMEALSSKNAMLGMQSLRDFHLPFAGAYDLNAGDKGIGAIHQEAQL
jgi:hypothetical protein